MSSLNLEKIKKSNRILSSLETSTKHSIRSYGNKSKNYELSKSNSQCILPVIRLQNKSPPKSESASILTKFITNHTSKIIKSTIDNLITPKIYVNIKRKVRLPSHLKSRININNYKSQSLNNIFSNKNNLNISYNNNNKNIFITEKEKNNLNFNQYINNNNSNIIEKNNIEDLTNIKNTNNEESFINEKDLNNMNIEYSNLISDIGNSNGVITSNNNNTIEKESNKNSDKTKINQKYSRLCRYEPMKIKNRNIIKFSYRKENPIDFFHIYNSDIKYQSNIFDEQIKLFKDKFKEYKSIMKNSNYINAFNNLPLEIKIKINKCLEESCGTLYILPNILLGEFYKLMLDLIKIDIPNEDKFLPKFIESEISALINNNNLLIEVNNYFNKCFEFYLIISQKEEGKENYLFEKKYFETLNYLQKLRYNIIYLINIFSNAQKNYIDDLSAINEFINSKNIINNKIINIHDDKDTNKEIYDKINNCKDIGKTMIRNNSVIGKIGCQIFYRKDSYEAKKERIESALDIFKEKKPQYNYLGKVVNNDKKLEYKSIFDNKHFDKILAHCYRNAKKEIITQRINNEHHYGKPKKGYKTIKINFGE